MVKGYKEIVLFVVFTILSYMSIGTSILFFNVDAYSFTMCIFHPHIEIRAASLKAFENGD